MRSLADILGELTVSPATKRRLTADQVLAVLQGRMEKRADVLEQVALTDYTIAVVELRRFAGMIGEARRHLGEPESS